MWHHNSNDRLLSSCTGILSYWPLKKNILFSSFTEKDGFILYVLSLSRFPNHEKVIIIDEIIQKLSVVYVLTYVQNYFHNEDYR